jgi:hypothetical protein
MNLRERALQCWEAGRYDGDGGVSQIEKALREVEQAAFKMAARRCAELSDRYGAGIASVSAKDCVIAIAELADRRRK